MNTILPLGWALSFVLVLSGCIRGGQGFVLRPCGAGGPTLPTLSSSRSRHHTDNVPSEENIVDEENQGKVDRDDELIALGRQEFQPYFTFPLDDWQCHAGGAICMGYNVVVCAPTGAGKTVVGEMALHHAYSLEDRKTGIYTTPLKALSNQKYSELCTTFGKTNTGLSTGDISINKGARITVMTTEVYRNMAWRSSTPSSSSSPDNAAVYMSTKDELASNAVVVLDEFHYMGYPGRGGVWEESIITSPSHTQIVGLSATLSNGPAIAAWMQSVTGRRTCLVNVPGELRPVPLRYLFATKEGLFSLFRDPDAGPGAPHGLLGYRSSEGYDDNSTKRKLPKGLHVNPALRAAAERRIQKVNKNLTRQRARFMLESKSGTNKEGDYSGGGRRSRPVVPSPRKMSPREERREKERLLRNEMRRAVPSISALVRRLDQKQLLPAIFFIFSRAGCDNAARTVYESMKGPSRDPLALLDEELEQFNVQPSRSQRRKSRQRRAQRQGKFVQDENGRTFRPGSDFIDEQTIASLMEDESISALDDADFDEASPLSPTNWEYYSKAGLLDYQQIRDVASRISLFNERNPEIEFDDDMAEQFLFGVGSHHAGMLPAHKSFVEVLYRNQLMKVVFATETLAAGINMPARTTVVCAMAKRGDGSSMNLLETSNLLQMAGRAGRRGFDEEGTCVIVATPFETHEHASKILTDPIKPIQSQFSPSYSLSVNLIARGEGKLDVARQLVSKSFAMWEKRQLEESVDATMGENAEGVNGALLESAQYHFMVTLQEVLQTQIDRRRASFDMEHLTSLMEMLLDKELLKKASKSYLSVTKMLELEETTLKYLNEELTNLKSDEEENEIYGQMVSEDRAGILEQIEAQQDRVLLLEKDVRKHPFSALTSIAKEIIKEDSEEGTALRGSLQNAREKNADGQGLLTATELSTFAKSSIVVRRKMRKVTTKEDAMDAQRLIQTLSAVNEQKDGSWEDMLAIVKTLAAYGCIQVTGDDDIPHSGQAWEQASYTISPAGMNVGMLGFENSLWALIAVGGAWDVLGASSNLDAFHQSLDYAEEDDEDRWYDDVSKTRSDNQTDEVPVAQQEAEKLLSLIRTMSPAELAGYVAAFVSDGARGGGGNGLSVVQQFHALTQKQQIVIQSLLQCQERLSEIQRLNNVDPNTRQTTLDLSTVEVVSAWADGCSWNEAIRISGGLPPGDLARTLGRVLDAVRQLGNLPYAPIRKSDMQHNIRRLPGGIHPDVRRLCREAAAAINRYPVKDPFSFEADDAEEEAKTADEQEIPSVEDASDESNT